MTIRTPSMVIEVSAIEVASTTLRVPGAGQDGGVLFLLAEIAVERRNHRPSSEAPLVAAPAVRRDFRLPGEKGEDRAALRPCGPRRLLVLSHLRCVRRRPVLVADVDQGKPRPRLSITGGLSSRPATRVAIERRRHHQDPQIVAQRRFVRRAPAQARNRRPANARGTRRRALSRRRASSGSSRIIRANTPSVTTSIRVSRGNADCRACIR